jgi:hypothetical protein
MYPVRGLIAFFSLLISDFLIKKGSWEQLNAKRQAINNATLVVGTLLFLSSALVS